MLNVETRMSNTFSSSRRKDVNGTHTTNIPCETANYLIDCNDARHLPSHNRNEWISLTTADHEESTNTEIEVSVGILSSDSKTTLFSLALSLSLDRVSGYHVAFIARMHLPHSLYNR